MTRSRPANRPKGNVPPRPSANRSSSVPIRPAPRARPRGGSRAYGGRTRHGHRWLAVAASALVVVVVAVLIIVKVATGSSGGQSASSIRTPVSTADLAQLEAIPLSTLVAAAQSASSSSVNPPANLPATVPSLTVGGKPEIFYAGAEYCPYCAAERWPLVMALSKFGTFQNLVSTKSSGTDANPNTPTFSFLGATYTSPYITFIPVELQDRTGAPLQTPTAAQTRLLNTYDASPYTSGANGTIPFVDLGGRYLVSGEEYDASSISNMSFAKAIGSMTSAANPASRAAEGVAGHLVGVICSLTHDQPASVCSAVPAALKTGQAGSSNQGSSSGG